MSNETKEERPRTEVVTAASFVETVDDAGLQHTEADTRWHPWFASSKRRTSDLLGIGSHSWVWTERQAAAKEVAKVVKRFDVALRGVQGTAFADLDPMEADRRIRNEYSILQRLARGLDETSHIVKPIELKVRRVTGVAYAIVMEGIEPVEEAQVVAWLHSSPMRVFRQLARAVAHAHTLQIAHRDIKPSNLVFSTRIDNTPRVVLIDWGHACDSRRALCTRKVEVTKAGTLAYRAPEVLVDSKRVSADLDNSSILFAQDIWSLGCLFLDLLFVGGHAHQYEADARFSCRTSQELLLWWTAYQAELDRSARSCLVESDSMMLPSMLHLLCFKMTDMTFLQYCYQQDARASQHQQQVEGIQVTLQLRQELQHHVQAQAQAHQAVARWSQQRVQVQNGQQQQQQVQRVPLQAINHLDRRSAPPLSHRQVDCDLHSSPIKCGLRLQNSSGNIRWIHHAKDKDRSWPSREFRGKRKLIFTCDDVDGVGKQQH